MNTSLPTYICPLCGAVSFNPNDIAERYCGRCHQFTGTIETESDQEMGARLHLGATGEEKERLRKKARIPNG